MTERKRCGILLKCRNEPAREDSTMFISSRTQAIKGGTVYDSGNIETLRGLAVPTKEQAGTTAWWWKPIAHSDILDATTRAIEQFGGEVQDVKAVVVRDIQPAGRTMDKSCGTVRFIPKGGMPMGLADGNDLSFSWMHSNDGKSALRLAGGIHTFICSNGMMIGDEVTRRLHHYTLQGQGLYTLVEGMVSRVLHGVEKSLLNMGKARNFQLANENVAGVVLGLARQGAIGWSDIRSITDLVFEGSPVQRERAGMLDFRTHRSLHDVVQAMTYTMGKDNPFPSWTRYRALNRGVGNIIMDAEEQADVWARGQGPTKAHVTGVGTINFVPAVREADYVLSR